MNTSNYFIFRIFFFILISCEKEYFPDGGIHFQIFNNTENTYDKSILYIGAVKDNRFIVTDSIISIDLIDKRISITEEFSKYIFEGWKPNLQKIKNKSNNGIFLFKLSEEKQLFLNPFSFPQPTLDEAILILTIQDFGLVNPEDSNNEIKQDYEIIK